MPINCYNWLPKYKHWVQTLRIAVSTKIRSVVVPAAGLGTRFLPATKTVPKELLPVVETPGIEICAEEATLLGAAQMIIVTSPDKQGVLEHFAEFPDLEDQLEAKGKHELLAKVRRPRELLNVVAVEQSLPLGLGHAVLQSEQSLHVDEDAFAVMLPDDVVVPMGVIEEMVKVRDELGGSVLCAIKVLPDEVSNYGIFSIECDVTNKIKKINGMVEKPEVGANPSLFAATGRYLLDRTIFDALRRTKPGKGGELQLTDAIEMLVREGHPVHILIHDGKRHDLGNPGGYIKACVEFGLNHPKYGPSIERYVTKLLEERAEKS